MDNADNLDLDLSPHFPVGKRGTVLITSRNPGCTVHATSGSCELGRMEEEEAITLMLRTAGYEDALDSTHRELARPVILVLGCLALAIHQAGAVVRQGLYNMNEYCEVYSRRRKELLSRKPVQGSGDYEYTVYTTWDISLRKIEDMANEAARDAIELLQTFGFFHHEGISEDIFRGAWENLRSEEYSEWMRSHQLSLLRQESETWDACRLREALSLLTSFSLISYDKDHIVSIHPLVHGWVRDSLDKSDTERIWTRSMCALAASVSSSSYNTLDYRPRTQLVAHIDACSGAYQDDMLYVYEAGEDCNIMAEIFAVAYREAGRLQKTLQLLKTVLAARKEVLGETHFQTVKSMQYVALTHSQLGQQHEALQLLERVVAAPKKMLNESDLQTLGSMHILAVIYSVVGREQEALALIKKVVAARKKVLGERHPDTLESMQALATIHKSVGQQQEALQLIKVVLEARREMLGERHLSTLVSMYALAVMYRGVDQQQEALQLIQKVVEGYKEMLGERHLHTLDSMHTLAIMYADNDREQEALQLLEPMVAAHQNTLGETHAYTLKAMHNLAMVHIKVGQQQEATQLLKQVVAARKETLGMMHPDTVSSMHGLARIYWNGNQHQKAQAFQLMKGLVAAHK